MKALLAIAVMGVLLGAAAQELPPGVPRSVSPDGTIDIPLMFTTRAYREEANGLLLREAGLVAEQLKLPEKLPITEADVVQRFISPFGYSYAEKRIGNVTTSKYCYGVEEGNKFSDLAVANYDNTCFELTDQARWPIARMDTKGPYQLATQWMAALSMDVKGLNQNCEPVWRSPHFGTGWPDSVKNLEERGSCPFTLYGG